MTTTIPITLGGRDFQVPPANIRRSRVLRTRISSVLGTAIDLLRDSPTLGSLELNDAQALTAVASSFKSVLLDSMDVIVDVVFEYSDELQSKRDELEDVATDDEAITAFLQIVKVLYPFGRVTSLLGPLLDTTKKS